MILPGKQWLSLWDLRKRLALLPRIAHERPLVAEFLVARRMEDWSLQVNDLVPRLEALPESRRTAGDVLRVLGRAWAADDAAAAILGLKTPYLSLALKQIDQVFPAAERFLEVRYEDLVRAAATTLPNISRFLGITFDERMLEHQSVANDLGDSYRAHHAGIRRSVFTTSIGCWL